VSLTVCAIHLFFEKNSVLLATFFFSISVIRTRFRLVAVA